MVWGGVWTVVGRGDRDTIPGLSDFWMAGVIGCVSPDMGDQQRGFPSMEKSSRGVLPSVGWVSKGSSMGEGSRGRALCTRTVGHQRGGGQRR